MAKRKREKRGSLAHQINERMKNLLCVGESRHEAKEDYRKNIDGNTQNKTVGIHSFQTFENYKNVCKGFTNWVKENYEDVRNIEDITEDHIKNYICNRSENGYSASTYSQDLAGLNKVFGTSVTKKDCGVSNRSTKNYTNNRELKEHHTHINLDNYANECDLIKGCGMRRSTLEKGKLKPNDFIRNDQGVCVGVKLKEKGGKTRIADIRESYQMRVTEIVNSFPDANEPMFNKLPNRLPTHRLRQEYAKGLYSDYIEKNGESDEKYRGLDSNAVSYVSENLGHSRQEVIKNYIF